MKSKSYFSLTLGVLALLSSQAFAGEITDWVNKDTAALAVGPSALGLAISGGALSNANALKRDAVRRLELVKKQEDLEKQIKTAERDYTIEKEKFDKALADSHNFSASRNVITLEAGKQRRAYKEALAKYRNLQIEYKSIKDSILKKYDSMSDMEQLAHKDLKYAEFKTVASKIGLVLSVPAGMGVAVSGAILRERREKAMKPGTDSGFPEITADSKAANKSAE